MPFSESGEKSKFQVALLTVNPTGNDDPNSRQDEDLKVVVVTQNKHMFRYVQCMKDTGPNPMCL